MSTYTGTAGNDNINGPNVAGPNDVIDALAGDDTVTIGETQFFASGPGNDTVSGTNGHGNYALWFATQRPVIDLSQGLALNDGFGGRDVLSGLDTLHLTGLGADVTGSAANETVWILGGANTIDLAGGFDVANFADRSSSRFSVTQAAGALVVKDLVTGLSDTLRGVEQLVFSDRSVAASYYTSPIRAQRLYTAYSFTETQWAPEYTYRGVTYPAAPIVWGTGAVFQLDLDGNGVRDFIAPMSKGYATGLDNRSAFVALVADPSGKLVFDTAINAQMPVTAGARREAALKLVGGSDAIVTVAHDGFDGRLADVELLRAGPGTLDASSLLPTLPLAGQVNRAHATNSHSVAAGDINGDGRDDIVVGEWGTGGMYALLQGADGAFQILRQPVFNAITNGWPMVHPGVGEGFNLLISVAVADINGDGWGDIVVGWGHGSTHSYVFLNDAGNFSVERKVALPDAAYGIDNQLHLDTMVADFNGDGHVDLAVLRTRYDPWYGGSYVQLLLNDGTGNFVDMTATNIDKPYVGMQGERLRMSDCWSVVDVNRDGAPDIVGQYEVGGAPVLYLNDGRGHFTVAGVGEDVPGNLPLSWGDWDGDGKLEYVAWDAVGLSGGTGNRYSFNVYELDAPIAATSIAPRIARGSDGADTISLGNGKSIAEGGLGDDTIHGTAGVDTAVYTWLESQYTAARVSPDVWQVSGPEGHDVLQGVERVRFADVNLALDIDGNAGKAYRLYQAAFDRKPDLGGLGYQMNALDQGRTLAQVAGDFLLSPEFQSKYGNVDDATFVTLLYQHVLHRAPQQFEVDFHVDKELHSGYSRAQVLTFFSESPENQANVIGDIASGMVYLA